MRQGLLFGVLAGVLVAFGAMPSAASAPTPRFVEGPCELPAAGVAMRCGKVIVPERRDRANGKSISLAVQVVLANRTPRSADPIILLGGGPGEILTDKAGLVAMITDLRDRDIILLDQRGVGLSRPALVCDEGERDERLDGFESDRDRKRRLKTCARRHAAETDLSAYSTAENAADVVDVIRALGYQRWNILGVSYGTRLGLAVMRQRPEGLRAVALDSPYPPQINGFDDKPALFFDQLDRLLADCAAEPACAGAYPDLKPRLVRALKALVAHPAEAQIVGRASVEARTATVTARLVLGDLRRTMYGHDALPRIPAALDRLASGDYAGFFARLDGPRHHEEPRVPGGFAAGMQLSIQCSDEGGWGGKLRAPRSDWPSEVVSAFQYPYGRPDCQAWQVDTAAPELHAPVVSDLPVLILAGQYDPVTPPELGEAILPDVKNGRLFVMPGLGHSITVTRCGQILLAQFMSDPERPIDAACVARAGETFRFRVEP